MLCLLTAASAADGVRPVSEETELRLQHGGPPGGRDVLAEGPDGALLGYARLDPDGEAAAELVVAPAARGAGVGTALLAHVEQLAGDRPVSVWAHGDLPAATALAQRRGYRRARVLLQMRRDLAGVEPDPHPALPADVRVLPFRPGTDEEAWLRVNARAFAGHPEQGAWTVEMLEAREQEDWFDPEGFVLAFDADGLAGFCWTKVHPPQPPREPDALGEIYVIGADPSRHGRGYGRALTTAGLESLAARGITIGILYVDADNEAAVGLYRALGFVTHRTDRAYGRDVAPAS